MEEVFEKYRNLLLQKRYSKNTIKVYCAYFSDFYQYFSNLNIDYVTIEDINKYILGLIKEKSISISQQNQRINAIKFYYEKVLNRGRQYYNLYRPKKEQKLPKVLSKAEIKKLIDCTINLKHKCIISLLYVNNNIKFNNFASIIFNSFVKLI